MKKLILVGLIVALLIVPMGCGKPEEDTYEDFVAEYYQTKLALHLLQNKYDELEASYEREQGRDAEYMNAINTLTGENEALRIEVALIKALGESRKVELKSALNELTTLRAEKQKWHILATKESDAILAKYNAIKDLYPPADFPNKDVLVQWRLVVGEVDECRELQRRAFADGYIVSLHPSFEYCVVIAGDYLYKITPGAKDLVEKIGKAD